MDGKRLFVGWMSVALVAPVALFAGSRVAVAEPVQPDVQRVCQLDPDEGGEVFFAPANTCDQFGYMDTTTLAVVEGKPVQQSWAWCEEEQAWGDASCDLAFVFGPAFMGSWYVEGS